LVDLYLHIWSSDLEIVQNQKPRNFISRFKL